VSGSAEVVMRIEAYHREPEPENDPYRSPLFGSRGLFADTSY